jgi:hypothetical protein
MPANINFYSAWYCPFAQRTWVALELLELPYDYEETNPYDKSDRWLDHQGKSIIPSFYRFLKAEKESSSDLLRYQGKTH